jgi:hypothetical protein
LTERPIALGITLIATDGTDVRSAFAVLYFLRSCRQRMRIQPKQAGAHNGGETGLLPTSGFLATAMHLPMVPSTKRHSEFVADFASKCPALCEAQVMGIRGLTTTNQTRLLGHIADVVAVAGLPHDKGFLTFLDRPGRREAGGG